MSTIFRATHSGDAKTLADLIKGSNVHNLFGDGKLFELAAWHGRKNIVETLIKAGVDVNVASESHGNALQTAANRGYKEIVEILIKAGADVNATNATSSRFGSPLQIAAFMGSIEIMETLIKAGADVNATSPCLGSALQAAARNGLIEVTEILINAGADVNVIGGPYGSPLQAAITEVAKSKALVRMLLEIPASINLRSRASDGSCLLHAAAASGETEFISELFKAGAEELINVKNDLGQTPFQLAVMSGNIQSMEIFYSFSNDFSLICEEKDADGRTSLLLAVEHEVAEVVKWLLERGARADARDFIDSTSFQRAFQDKNFEILSMLFPKTTQDDRQLSASQWQSVQPGGYNEVVWMTGGKLATVEMISYQLLIYYLGDWSYSLQWDASDIRTKEKSMAEDTPEKRLL